MGYHLVDSEAVDQLDDRPADVRSISGAAGLEPRNSKLGLRRYDIAPGQQMPLSYHYHDEQVEAFYVVEGALHVKTPEGDYVVEADQTLLVEPGSPQFAYNPEEAGESVLVLAVGAPSADDAHTYEPEEG